MKKKIIIPLISAFAMWGGYACADVLGTKIDQWALEMGADTVLNGTVYMSEDAAVQKQSEYYVAYTPNQDAVPVVINGESIYGSRNINEAASYMKNNGLRPLIGVNADYFSFKTGIPMGHTIMNGEIASKEAERQNAVGFRKDGSAFIGELEIKTTMTDISAQTAGVNVEYINKWCQPGFDPIYLLNDKFGKSTKTSSKCVFVIMSPVEGALRIDTQMTLSVDEVFEYDGDIAIPEGKYVALMDVNGKKEYYDFLSSIKAGDTILISNEAVDDLQKLWQSAESGLGSVGGRLIKNGEIQSGFEPGAAPRTAVGIREDGSVIFYVIDGRQKGYSYGVQISTLAKRLKELGCIDALNLDGGGSTTMAGVYPGSDIMSVVNSPSDGYLRNVANFIFLEDKRKPTGIAGYINIKEIPDRMYLAGMTEQIEIGSVYDTHNYKMEIPDDIRYGINNLENGESIVDENGMITFMGTGSADVTVKTGDALVQERFYSYRTPDMIKIYDGENEITEINIPVNAGYKVDLDAYAYIGDTRLKSRDNLFTWTLEGDIGTIDEEGVFVSNGESGVIKIGIGEYTKEIKVEMNNPFADTQEHWARDILSKLYKKGTIKGIEENGNLYYKPDSDMTRAEFATVISNAMGLLPNNKTEFYDKADIPAWAYDAVSAVYEKGYMTGKENIDKKPVFAPNDKITRAEVFAVMDRINGKKADVSVIKEFADSGDIPAWARDSIQHLYISGVISGYEDNTIRPNICVKRAEAAVMLDRLGI